VGEFSGSQVADVRLTWRELPDKLPATDAIYQLVAGTPMHRLEDFLSRKWPGAAQALLKRSRVLTRWGWAAMAWYQTRRGTPPLALRQLARMEPALAPGDEPRVLVFSVRGWPT
jgi:hypothetical protein